MVPQFWSHFSSPTADTRAGFEAVCVAVRHLAGEVGWSVLSCRTVQCPGCRWRGWWCGRRSCRDCGTAATPTARCGASALSGISCWPGNQDTKLWLYALLSSSLRGTMHSQLDSVKADWRALVTQFYTRSFTVWAGRAWRAGLLDSAEGGPEDSGDWGQVLYSPALQNND